MQDGERKRVEKERVREKKRGETERECERERGRVRERDIMHTEKVYGKKT